MERSFRTALPYEIDPEESDVTVFYDYEAPTAASGPSWASGGDPGSPGGIIVNRIIRDADGSEIDMNNSSLMAWAQGDLEDQIFQDMDERDQAAQDDAADRQREFEMDRHMGLENIEKIVGAISEDDDASTQETSEGPNIDEIIQMTEWEDKIPGGFADGRHPAEFCPEQLKMGIEVEFEHTDDPYVACEISMDHLAENENYYTYLAKMENQFKADAGEEAEEKLEEAESKEQNVEDEKIPLKKGPGNIVKRKEIQCRILPKKLGVEENIEKLAETIAEDVNLTWQR